MAQMWCIGENGESQLGTGDSSDLDTLTQVGSLETWSRVFCLDESTIAMRTNGTIWGTGKNNYGQLGLGHTSNIVSFTQIGTDNDWDTIATLSTSVLAIKNSGTLWGVGQNTKGHLGFGDTSNRSEFTQVGADSSWSSVAIGSWHALAIKTDGTLWSCGYNNKGQLGQNDFTERHTFTQVGSDTDWASVSCSEGSLYNGGHSLAIKTNGTLWSCGYNFIGQLGQGNTTDLDEFTQVGIGTDWSEVACGRIRSHALQTDGSLFGCGENGNGELGTGDTVDLDVFTQENQGLIVNKIVETSGYFCIVRVGTTLYGTGKNDEYQLVNGTTDQSNSFTLSTETKAADFSCNSGNSTYDGFTFVIKAPYVPGKHRSSCGGIRWQGKELVGDFENGLIYSLEDDVYTDNGRSIIRTRRTQIINKNRVNIINNRLEIEFEAGIGLNVASGDAGYDPQALLKWSDDGGNTWSTGRSVPIGEYQQYGTRAVWRSLGKSRNRIYELSIESPVKIILIGTYAKFKECGF